MKSLKPVFVIAVLIAIGLCGTAAEPQSSRWPEQKASAWYAQQPWLVGSSYTRKAASKQLEMWRGATFNPDEIDQELAWAESLVMNTMRVCIRDALSQPDAAGLQ